MEGKFYKHGRAADPVVCQGDIVKLRASLPLLDAEGQPTYYEHEEFEHWLVVSNTCDHERVDTVQLSPLLTLPPETSPEELATLRRYAYAKRFYVPPWPGDIETSHRIADFTRLTMLEKAAFGSGTAEVVARLDFPGWAILHTCLVMYLARDDGRYD